MKSKIITLFFLLSSFSHVFATHNVAGNITFKQVGSMMIEATIHTFTVASSVPADRDSLTLCWGDGICEIVPRDQQFDLGNNRLYNTYIAVHTYDAFDSYTLSMTDPNRNGGILNLNFPGSENVQFHLQTEVKLSTDFNQSPILLEAPLDIGFTNVPFFHNPNAFDPDGDSLAYKLIVPMEGIDSPVANYVLPNLVGQSPSSATFSINETTGTIFWNAPQEPGLYVIAFEVEEYRDGVKISSTIRDMQVTIEPFGLVGNPPKIVIDEDVIVKEAGETIEFDVILEDAESDVKVTATGGPFEVENPANFQAPDDFQPAPLTTSFEWETTTDHARKQPYQVVFKVFDKDADDKGAMTLEVIEIFVSGDPTSTEIVMPSKDFHYWPNPTNHSINFHWFQEEVKGTIDIEILNQTGQVVKKTTFENTTKDFDSLNVSDLLPGIYFIKIGFGNEFQMKKLRID